MHLRIALPRYRSSTPHAPAVAGYGCRLEPDRIVCRVLSVHLATTPRKVTGRLYDRPGRPKRVTLWWPGLPEGVHEEVELFRST